MTYYAVYTPNNEGDGEHLGPFHKWSEAHKAALDLAEQVKAGIKVPGEVVIMNDMFKVLETIDTQEAKG